MPLRYTVPVALYGFLIAATWIDVISDQLVNVLEFVGVSMRIPSPIIGMTVLAWGNSVGDYSTNSALAQKGFSDMR
jgi:sodium/potassium/calcium exchanger 6